MPMVCLLRILKLLILIGCSEEPANQKAEHANREMPMKVAELHTGDWLLHLRGALPACFRIVSKLNVAAFLGCV